MIGDRTSLVVTEGYDYVPFTLADKIHPTESGPEWLSELIQLYSWDMIPPTLIQPPAYHRGWYMCLPAWLCWMFVATAFSCYFTLCCPDYQKGFIFLETRNLISLTPSALFLWVKSTSFVLPGSQHLYSQTSKLLTWKHYRQMTLDSSSPQDGHIRWPDAQIIAPLMKGKML